MKLLIITQKVDERDANLGFFHQWIETFAHHVEHLTVICLEEGTHHLPPNVRVMSLGKEVGASRFTYITRFLHYILAERKMYDSVFVHMNPEYIVLGGWVWMLLRKKVGLWYTHKSVTRKLKIAESFVSVIFSASKESFRLPTKKLMVTGHGIDTARFAPRASSQSHPTLLTAGRISPSKNIRALVEAVHILHSKGISLKLNIAGGPITDQDKIYFSELQEKVRTFQLNKVIHFVGNISAREMPAFYQSGQFFINLSDTGSIDKAVLEAMSSGLIVLTSNEAFKEELRTISPELFLESTESPIVAERIEALLKMPQEEIHTLQKKLRERVVKNHNLDTLIKRIINIYHGK
jgi:glycosyltransferase involved in cell wall biosynthesis